MRFSGQQEKLKMETHESQEQCPGYSLAALCTLKRDGEALTYFPHVGVSSRLSGPDYRYSVPRDTTAAFNSDLC